MRFISEVKEVVSGALVWGVLGSVDTLDAHQRDAAAVQASRLALDVVEIVQDFEFVIAQIRRVAGKPCCLRGL